MGQVLSQEGMEVHLDRNVQIGNRILERVKIKVLGIDSRKKAFFVRES